MKNILFILIACCWGASLLAQTGVYISNGASLYMSGDVHLVLHEADLENNGSLEGNGNCNIAFEGNTLTGLYGSSNSTLYNLKINKGNDMEVLLYSDIVVENDLDMSQGILNLNGQHIQLEGQIVNENELNYIQGASGGYIELVAPLDNPNQINPGNIGIAISSTANLGNTTIRRGHLQQSSADGGYGINRYFDITPENNSNLDATLRMYYHDIELAAVPESELELWRSIDSGNSWELVGVSDSDMTNNYVEQWGINAFSRWTLGSARTAALPVELLDFRGIARTDDNLLEWTTSSEENLSHFKLEKIVLDEWEMIAEIEATHFSTAERHYQFQDRYVSQQEHYRLRMVDFDAREAFSKIISIRRADLGEPVFSIFPNPAVDYINLVFSEVIEVKSIRLLTVTGQEVLVFSDFENALNLSRLPVGIYYLEVQTVKERYVEKITKL